MSFRRITILAAVALLAITLAVGTARAQTGSPIADFTLKTASNADVALKSYAGNKAVVVVFLNPACAFSRLYQERLASLSSAYRAKGVEFLFINVPINLDAPGTAAPGEVELPTLTDPSQQVSNLLGVTKTAEAVVLEPNSGGFIVRYRGAIDDNPQVASNVQQHYLKQVLDNVLAGRPAGVAERRAAGCLIKR
ncbi:redoxin domain-containing protein [Hymenobacter sp. BT770]|uniref:redoxin domain-containing protein n=1 Tax=Hymenobacter sp. BT770 TaxID=2886942 RepID=UPI001D0FCA1E|nr:redoxin domain-containing protein [Hymenobacter sp. BT770]MCC3152897.1 redoxin domain-containing protein [Hymenobacter sp. BT770]MDO3414972.1 redoxin domain-containing protein [Hymenobacter sp. BT770]